jgi:hypothetical protein
MSLDGSQTPQRVVESVGLKDRKQRQRLVVGSGFAEPPQQFCPAASARIVCADFV